MKLISLKEKPEEIIDIIIKKLKNKYKKRLLFVGGKGSLATDKFTPLSDLDLVVALDKGKEEYFEFIYGTTYIDIKVSPLKKLMEEIKNIDTYWPLRAGGLLNLKLYYEKNNSFNILKKTFNTVKKNKKAFEHSINLNSFIEYYSKAHRAYQNKEYKMLSWAAFELYEMFILTLALLNQEYYISQGPNRFIEQIQKFKYKPKDWKSGILLSLSKDPKKEIKGIDIMWKILNNLKKKNNLRSYDISKIEDIKF